MKNTMKRFLTLMLVLAMVLSCVPVYGFAAETGNVAKVGNTEYATIDEAIAAWTNNTTLTLLADVTLSDVITLNSTEHHILNLGTYTMTAASGKNAIVIKACGTGDAERYAITIKADDTNPGGINAGTKSVVYYKYADGGISGNDRPIIKIEGGVFTGSTSNWGTAGIYTIGTAARKCATLNISGGTFNCSINGSSKSKLLVSGGTFNYSVGSQGDSTALRLISGGRFKTLGFMTADANNTKFWFGTSMGNSNVGLYVDNDGYLVVGGPVITELSSKYVACASNATKWSSYLAYSSAATNGLYYTNAERAIAKHGEANVTIYEKPPVTIPEDFLDSIVGEDATDEEKAAVKEVVKEIENNTALKAAPPKYVPEGAELVITLSEVHTESGTIVYDVAPMANGEKVENLTEAIVFRLPVPASVTMTYAKVYHEGELMGIYEIKGEGNAKYVEITSADFSEYAVEPVGDVVCAIGDVGYLTLADAVDAIPEGTTATPTTITLLKDLELATYQYAGPTYPQNIVLDLGGHTLSSTGRVLAAYRDGTTLTVQNGTVIGGAATGSLVATYYGTLVLGENLTVKTNAAKGAAVYVNRGNLIADEPTVWVEGYKAVMAKGEENVLTITRGRYSSAISVLYMPEGFRCIGDNGAFAVVGSVAVNDDEHFGSLADAIEAAQDGDTVSLLTNLALDASVTNKKNITLDLNGKTITGTDTTSKNFGLINNNGTLTVKDSVGGGKITLTATVDSGWSRYSAVISNNPGGTLVIESGTLEHLGGTAMAYGIDSLTNGGIGNVSVTVNGGTIKSTYRGIRQFANSTTCTNTLVINGGTVEGTNKAVWLHGANAKANKGDLTIGGTANVGDVYVWADGTTSTGASAMTLDIKAENVNSVINGLPAGCDIPNIDGSYTLKTGAAKIGFNYYDSLADAIAAAQDNETIVLLSNVNVDADDLVDLDGYHTFFKIEGKSITIDLNGKTIYADASTVTDKFVVGVFSATNGGNLILKDSKGTGTVQGYSGETQEAAYLVASKGNTDYNYKFYSLLVVYDDECSITVEGGNYILDYAGDSLAYTSCNEGIVVNGGTFKLGNLGGIRNGMPWVFNARGQNIRHVVVNGGSFCADIQHQYYPFEVSMPKDKALKNENGMYTVVDAVAYVTEREWSSAWYTNEVGYATLEEAIAACEGPKTKSKKTSEQEVVVLLKDVELTDTVTVAADKSVILDLNGKTVSYKNTEAKASCAINNKGTLTIKNGTITYEGVGDPNYGYGTNTINNSGALVIEDASIINTTNSGSSVAIDCSAGAKLTINSGVVKSQKNAIRLCPFGAAAIEATINGGTITGARAVQIQLPSNKPESAPEVKLTINGGTLNGTGGMSIYSYSAGQSFENVKICLNGGTYNSVVAFGGGTKATTETVTIADECVFNDHVLRYLANDEVYYHHKHEVTQAESADMMVDALEKGFDVVLTDDVKIDPAGMSSGYGTTGINVKNGQTVDGGGYVLDISEANGTWDSGINTTGGTIKNITVTGSFRGIFINHNSDYTAPVILENVIIDGTTYTISCDQGNYQTLTATSCTFKGWTSYAATLGNAKFIGCYFGEGNGYAFCRPYAPTDFVNCDFEEGFRMDPRAEVTFENCRLNGVEITAENVAELVYVNTDRATVK